MPNGARNWCLTFNNYGADEEDRFRRVIFAECGYGVVGKEIGESGTHHLQCYVQLRSRRGLRHIKSLFGNRVHAEVARGRPDQAAEYCKKDGDFWEHGVLKSSGVRSDLNSFIAAAKEGITWEEALETCPSVVARYPKFADRVISRFAGNRDWVPEVYVYWGDTGTGKSRRAFQETEEPYVHSGGNWFDGYSGEAEVIFDDFGGSEFKLTYLLKLLDRYPMRVPIKGGFVNWVPRKVFITSNYSPKDWFPNAKEEHVKALFRRITKSIQFRKLLAINGDELETEVIVL